MNKIEAETESENNAEQFLIFLNYKLQLFHLKAFIVYRIA